MLRGLSSEVHRGSHESFHLPASSLSHTYENVPEAAGCFWRKEPYEILHDHTDNLQGCLSSSVSHFSFILIGISQGSQSLVDHSHPLLVWKECLKHTVVSLLCPAPCGGVCVGTAGMSATQRSQDKDGMVVHSPWFSRRRNSRVWDECCGSWSPMYQAPSAYC